MKKINYKSPVCLKQNTGEVAYANCSDKAGKREGFKHVVVLLFQLLKYIELDSKVMPGDLPCA